LIFENSAVTETAEVYKTKAVSVCNPSHFDDPRCWLHCCQLFCWMSYFSFRMSSELLQNAFL